MPRKSKTAAPNGAAGEPKSETSVAKAKTPRPKSSARKTTVRQQRKKSDVTDDAIRLRAYFISQDRRRHGLSSDPNSDWIEARRQLLQEKPESAR